MRWFVALIIAFLLIPILISSGLGIFNWYIGVPQMKHAAKICPMVPEEYDCYGFYRSQAPAVWLLRLFK